MNNIITIRQFVTILQQKGFMEEQPEGCESVVLSFFHTIAEALRTEDIVTIDGLGDFTIVNRESGLIVFMPDQALAETVNEPFAFFEPTEISDDISKEMLDIPTPGIKNDREKEKEEVKEKEEQEEDSKKPTGPVKVDPQDRNAYVISVPKTENTYHEQTSVSQPGAFEETPDPKTLEREEELKREQELRRELERELDIRREIELKQQQERRKAQEDADKAKFELEPMQEPEELQSESIQESFIDENTEAGDKPDDVVDYTETEEESTEVSKNEEPVTMKPEVNYGHSTITLVAISILALAIGFVAGLFSAEHLFGDDDDDDIGYQSNVAEQIELLRNELFSPEETQKLDSAINKSIEEQASNDSTINRPTEVETSTAPAIFNDETTVLTDTVKENYYLTHMSRQYYGGAMEFWVYIYLENQDHLGRPDKIHPNTVVVIPPADKYGIDPQSKKSIDLAKQIASEINSKYK